MSSREPVYYFDLRLLDVAPWLFGGVQGLYTASVPFLETPEDFEIVLQGITAYASN